MWLHFWNSHVQQLISLIILLFAGSPAGPSCASQPAPGRNPGGLGVVGFTYDFGLAKLAGAAQSILHVWLLLLLTDHLGFSLGSPRPSLFTWRLVVQPRFDVKKTVCRPSANVRDISNKENVICPD